MTDQAIRPIEFTKMSGAGNDFVILDNRKGVVTEPADFARKICDRRFGIGADGILLLESSSKADFLMKYYNADGSYGGMCGNGGRCISRFAFAKEIVKKSEMSFEALDYIYNASLVNDDVKLRMKAPTDIRLHTTLEALGGKIVFHFINTGSPHCIVFIDENKHLGTVIDKIDVESVGREIRRHSYFSPGGTNVTFVEQRDPTLFYTRTYERGVEAETLACGTGSVATALIAHRVRGAMPPLRILVRSGEYLTVGFVPKDENKYDDVTLLGSAHISFKGVLDYNFTSHSIADIA
jgi:diaminopimelate epimerase